ncbi:MAG TPA: tetratricopeptide repeat protein [Terriglobales bacterium]|nr:tetratricopeptide repeat protein [Terriglobales bacterium]
MPALLYMATLRFEFVFDDHNQIVGNPLIKSWHNLPWLFRTDVWSFSNPLVLGNYWRPFFTMWLLVNHSLFGLNPAGWHAAAVLVHVAATFLVFRLVRKLSGDLLLSAFAALIFTVHPSHLETVAWISGATDSLMTVFVVSSLLCFVNAFSQTSLKWKWLAASLLLYAGGLLVKETAMMTPMMVLAYFVFAHRTSLRGHISPVALSIVLLALVTIAYATMRAAVLGGMSHPIIHMTLAEIILNAPLLLWFYVKHLVYPIGLGLYYDIPPVLQMTWANFWFPVFALLAVTAGVLYWAYRAKERLAIFGFVVMMVPLLPVLYIPGLAVDDIAHDRYLYVPSIGFAIIVASLIRRIRWGSRELFSASASQFAVAVVVVLGLSAATSAQQIYWANDVLLFSRAIEVAPGKAVAYNNLGTALTAKNRYKEARFAYQQVVMRNPRAWSAYYNLGLGYFIDGQYAEAEENLKRALSIMQLESDPYAVLAESQIKLGKYAEAEQAVRTAIRLKPYKPGYRQVLALALEKQGRIQEAQEAAKEEQQLQARQAH